MVKIFYPAKTVGLITFTLLLGMALLEIVSVGADDNLPQHCSLLSQQDVSELMGKPVKPSEETPLGCAWVPEGKNISYFTVFIKAESRKARVAVGHREGDFDVIDIRGVGDDAVAVIRKSSENILDLYVHKGKYLVRFNMPFLGIKRDSDRFKNLVTTAQKAAGRL